MTMTGDYVVLARKYRPQGFDEIVGQPAVATTLANALGQGAKRLHHAYLFTGPRGIGKTTTARILAKALNCVKGPTPQPCGECAPCREIALSSCLDVLEMDAASNTGVDNVREVIIETVGLAPTRDRYKVFIIDEAHMLSTAAFNALLKTLEEPPAHVVFILATTESARIPATIASRCQRFKFRPVAVEALAAHLASLAKKEKISIEPAALELLARSADGSLRDAVGLLDQCRSAGEKIVTGETISEMFGLVPRELLLDIGRALLAKDGPALAQKLSAVYDEGVEPAQLLKDLRAALEGVYVEKVGGPARGDPAWRALAAETPPSSLSVILRRINKTLEELRLGDAPRLILELGLFGCLEAVGDLAAWVERLERLEKRLSIASASSSPIVAAVARPVVNPTATPEAGALWVNVITAVYKDKAALGAALEKAQLDVTSDTAWRLVFPRAFDLEQAQRGLPLIQSKLAALAGKPMTVTLALGTVAEPLGEVVDTTVSMGGGAPASGVWRDVTAEPPATDLQTTTSLKKAENILGGRMKFIKKSP